MRFSEEGLRLWVRLTVIGAVALTAFDALLLQKSKSFFTGGFLAPLHTSGWAEALGFFIVSALSDVAVIGFASGGVLILTSRVRLTRAARTMTIALAGGGPLLAMDIVNYRLHSYLGDAFDFGLMFELAGRRTDEILAVASPQILQASMAIALTGLGAGCAVWAFNRSYAQRRIVQVSARHTAAVAIGLVVAALASTAAGVASETYGDGLRRKPSGRLVQTLLAAATDVDRDGFGLVGPMADPALFDASIYPWAVDLPGNGIDEDGVGGDLPADVSEYREGPSAPVTWVRKPNVVLFVLESFRADAVGRYVDGKPVTPVLDQLAREGVSTERAYSHNGYTAQSRFHLLTGSVAGPRGRTSLIDDFAANGYETAYFSAQDESFGGPGLSVGFERAFVAYDARKDRDRRYSTFTTPGSLAVSFATLEARIAEFLARRSSNRPLFLYVNFHDTHFPYHHKEIAPIVSAAVIPQANIAPPEQEALRRMYFNTAANVDRAVGRVIERVAATATAAPAVIVTADHGESLFEENFLGHGYALNDVQTRVPLIVRGLPMTVEEPFGQSDLRDALAAALAAGTSDTSPRRIQPPGKRAFQYLGNVDRPRQIGFVGESGRTIYDFRRRKVLTEGARWRSPSELEPTERTHFLELVHTWERMVLARSRQ